MSPDVTVPTRVTRAEAEHLIVEAGTSDLPAMQALARKLRAALDAAPAQQVFHFWPELPS